MDNRLIEKVLDHFVGGDDVFFGVDYLGTASIKIKYGPLKLRTLVYETDPATAEVIKDEIFLLSANVFDAPMGDDQHPSTETTATLPEITSPESPPHTLPKEHDQLPEVRRPENSQDASKSNIPPVKYDNKIDSISVTSFGFAEADIAAAWLSLVEGPMPPQVERIWVALSLSNSVTKIAFQAQVTIRECMIWICVFRQYLGISENITSGIYKYNRDPRHDDLALIVSNADVDGSVADDPVISAPRLSGNKSGSSDKDPDESSFPLNRWKAYSRLYKKRILK